MFMKQNIFKKILAFIARLMPRTEIFGLEISDGLVRFYDIGKSESKARHILLRLPPGVVSSGRVLNASALQATLEDMHKRVVDNQRKVMSVVVTLPINNIYIQPFSLPTLASENLVESAALNMRMISPIDVSKAYYDWQELGENITRDQLDMVGAFASREVIDKFIEVIQSANFSIAAVEFSSLSLIRAALSRGMTNKEAPSLILQIDQGGLGFAVSHLGELYFHHFTEWDRYRDGGKQIDTEKFKEGIIDEVGKLINFYLTNFKTGDIKNVLVVAENFAEEVKIALQNGLPGTQVQIANFNQVNPAVGAAVRGRISRSQDASISLGSLSAVEVFHKSQISNFISIWRNLAFTTFGFLLLVFLGSALMLQRTADAVVAGDPFMQNRENSAELVELERQVEEFNDIVVMLSALTVKGDEIYETADRLQILMGVTVGLRRLTITVEGGGVTIGGIGYAENTVKEFKSKLEKEEQFMDVDLPLQEFKTNIDGTIDFIIRLKLKIPDS